jgi:hypothetical protein
MKKFKNILGWTIALIVMVPISILFFLLFVLPYFLYFLEIFFPP